MRIKLHKNWSVGKAFVMGSCFSNPKGEVQQHEETIYYCGWLSIIIVHKMKFMNVTRKISFDSHA